MDILTGKIRPLYFRYLSAAFGSALISSIYGTERRTMLYAAAAIRRCTAALPQRS